MTLTGIIFTELENRTLIPYITAYRRPGLWRRYACSFKQRKDCSLEFVPRFRPLCVLPGPSREFAFLNNLKLEFNILKKKLQEKKTVSTAEQLAFCSAFRIRRCILQRLFFGAGSYYRTKTSFCLSILNQNSIKIVSKYKFRFKMQRRRRESAIRQQYCLSV